MRGEMRGGEPYMLTTTAEHPDAETAMTRYRTLSSRDVAALVELSPRTGRMHQLRVHMASIGVPIAGDARYGGALTLAGVAVPRLMLHASALGFPHPAGGEQRLGAPIPPDMALIMRTLGLDGTSSPA